MSRPIKLLEIGSRYGRYVVIARAERKGRDECSLCRCDCGVEKVVRNTMLRKGTIVSCGCYSGEQAAKRNSENRWRLKHGLRAARSITYQSWSSMIYRCTNPKHSEWPRYGGRGITVCARWLDPDKGVLNFIEDVGERPSSAHSIDRIDGTKGYEPGNCRWATKLEQSRNGPIRCHNKSGYKGVMKYRKGWRMDIRAGDVYIMLAGFDTKEEAALAYNIASEKLHGAFGGRNPLPPMNREVVKTVIEKVNAKLANKTRSDE